MADFCGLQPPHPLAGQSLRPLLADPSRKGREAAFTLVARGGGQYGQAVRTEGWRYIRWSDGANELYNEADDPEETHDLASDPRQAARIQEMQKLLKKVGPFQPSETGERQRPKRARKSSA